LEGIWIIIFIIAMLFQIFKKIGEVKTDLPKGRQGQELPPIFSEGPLPWEMDEPEDEGLGPLARQETERPDSAREDCTTVRWERKRRADCYRRVSAIDGFIQHS